MNTEQCVFGDAEEALLNSVVGKHIVGWKYGGRTGIPTITLHLDDGRQIGFTATPDYYSDDQDRCETLIGVEAVNPA